MTFEYQSSTRDAYKNAGVAEKYHTDFTGRLNWRRLRFRFVANRERRAIDSMLRLIHAKTVVDIPAGTGKLAAVVAAYDYEVIAADVSPDMLEIARDCYANAGLDNTEFELCDLESASETFAGRDVDLIICLRLMHRVPRDVSRRMLNEIAKTAEFAIVSFGVDSPYQRRRRKIRNKIFGGGEGKDLCLQPLSTITADVNENFRILKRSWISPLISEEIVYLLQSKLHSRDQA